MKRFRYLQALVTEYSDSDDAVAKEQVLANLSNFAFDATNYEWFRRLCIIDLFLDSLEEESPKIKEFGIGGLCNLCIDPKNSALIVEKGGLLPIMKCLSSSNEETVLSAITTLYYLLSPVTCNVILIPTVIECMEKYSSSRNSRLSNLSILFLEASKKFIPSIEEMKQLNAITNTVEKNKMQ